MEHPDFSAGIAGVYPQALEQANRILAKAEKIRQQVNLELDAAAAILKQAEEKGKQKPAEYCKQSQLELLEATHTTLLQKLVQKLLAQNKSPGAIATWLDVTEQFVTTTKSKMERANQYQQNAKWMQLTGNPTLLFKDEGRGGTIDFTNEETTFSLWWEFAGDNAIATIEAPGAERWAKHSGLRLMQRNDLLTYIGEQAIAKKLATGGYFKIDKNSLTIYKNQGYGFAPGATCNY